MAEIGPGQGGAEEKRQNRKKALLKRRRTIPGGAIISGWRMIPDGRMIPDFAFIRASERVFRLSFLSGGSSPFYLFSAVAEVMIGNGAGKSFKRIEKQFSESVFRESVESFDLLRQTKGPALGGGHGIACEETPYRFLCGEKRQGIGGDVIITHQIAGFPFPIPSRIGDVFGIMPEFPGQDDSEDSSGVCDVSETAFDSHKNSCVGNDPCCGLQIRFSRFVDQERVFQLQERMKSDFDDMPAGTQKHFRQNPPVFCLPLPASSVGRTVKYGIRSRQTGNFPFRVEVKDRRLIRNGKSCGTGKLFQEARENVWRSVSAAFAVPPLPRR